MATKKHVLAKAVPAKSKPVEKKVVKAAKPAPRKLVKAAPPAPAKKTAPAKVVSKPVAKKTVKTEAAKVISKPLATKTVIKPVLKKVNNKVMSNKTVIPVAKSVKPSPKVAPVKTPVKPITTQTVKKPLAVKNTSVNVANSVKKIMPKKEETKNAAAKTATEKTVSAQPAAAIKAKDIKVPAPKPVVMPKIVTKTVRKYQPEFTKSVLDKAQRDPGAPSQRYSDAELQEFRELIQRKLEAAKKELSYLHGLITRKDEMGGDEGDNRYMTMEDGSLSMEREQLSQMASRQITFIDHLEKAVMRIENKTYGICRVTGKLIDKARLRAVPHATLSIEAKMGAGK